MTFWKRPIVLYSVKKTLLCFLLILTGGVHGSENLLLEIVEPYLDIRTGPGKSYPIYYIAQRGENIEVLKRRNNWFKIRLEGPGGRAKSGWVHRDSIGETWVANITPDRDNPLLAKNDPSMTYIFDPKFYMGFNYGQMTAADFVGVRLGYQITDVVSVELQAEEFLARDSEGNTWALAASFAPFTHWRLSPYVQLGGGEIHTSARGTNSQQNNGTDSFLQTAVGIQVLLTKQYRLSFEYRNLNVLTSGNENGELETWHIGFSAYF